MKIPYLFIPFVVLMITVQVNGQLLTVKSGETLFIKEGETITVKGDLDNQGTIAGKGTLDVTGAYSQTGTFDIYIGPTKTEHTTLSVTGVFTPGGTFTVTNVGGYTPLGGDNAIIVTSSGAIGSTYDNASHNDWIANYNLPASGNFTISYSTPVPVELIFFLAKVDENRVKLEWKTASESNNEGFYIERCRMPDSRYLKDWETLGFVAGKGTSMEPQKYQCTDLLPHKGINYYRLKQMDFDGQSEYSDIVSIAFRGDDTVKDVVIYPNPVQHGSLGVYLPVEKATLQLYDAVGKLVHQQEVSGTTATINTENVAAGIYWLEVISAGERWVEKVVVK